MIRDYDPTNGQAYQGDVSIIPIPDDIPVSRLNEVQPVDGRLILQEGELTGHHHAVTVRRFRDATAIVGDPVVSTRSKRLTKAFASTPTVPVANAQMFHDPSVAQAMQQRGILTRTDLVVGCLVVAESTVVTHHEHDGIRLPPGSYIVGRQIESAGAEERRVAD